MNSKRTCRHCPIAMQTLSCLWQGLLLLSLLISPANISAQHKVERSDLRTPGLVVETDCPTTRTTTLFFSADSRTLFAAGLDKVVREWKLSGDRLDRHSLKTHRWAIYREQRGCIYCAALSHDFDQSLLAVAGFGLRNGSIAVLDRMSGTVVHALKNPQSRANVISLAFLQDRAAILIGRSDGTVAIWHYQQSDDAVLELGSHAASPLFFLDLSKNYILGLSETSPGRLVTVAEDGSVMQWDCAAAASHGRALPRFQMSVLYQTAFSADGSFCAVFGSDGTELMLSVRDMRRPDALEMVVESTSEYKFEAVTLGPDGRSIMFVRESLQSGKQELAHFTRNDAGQYHQIFSMDLPEKVERIVLAPTGDLCAVAMLHGGIRLWDVRRHGWTDQLTGPGECVNEVAFSIDGTQFGFRSGNRPAWRVFDMRDRNWASLDKVRSFQPVPAPSKQGAWKIAPNSDGSRIWHLGNIRTGQKHRIPTVSAVDLEPQCSLFLEPEPGQVGIRFILGHQWGASLFEYREGQEIQLLRRFVGHQSEVTCLGVSSDKTRLITGANDQTISVWDLTPWPHQSQLGADFELRDGRLFVRHVAEGSPAWEATLESGDEIVRLAHDGQHLDTSPRQWFRILQSPIPGKEIVFYINRSGADETIVTLTTTRQRPIWRFFASRDNEWVLWRWRDYYYDCSLNGDAMIGWQINGDVDETPTFTVAEQSRHRFHRPDLVAEVLTSVARPVTAERIHETELIQPQMRLVVSENPEKKTWNVTISVMPPDHEKLNASPREVWLWLNDQKIHVWRQLRLPFAETISLSSDQLRAGENYLMAQAYSRHLVRGDSETENIHSGIPPLLNSKDQRLFALCVGVNNYSHATTTTGAPIGNLLFCREDAQGIADVLRIQQMLGAFRRVDVEMLGDQMVSRQRILDQLESLESYAKPDDVFVLFLAGHGWAKPLSSDSSVIDPTTFVFVTPNFDAKKPQETGLNFFQKPDVSPHMPPDTLYDRLAKLPCHKIVILDCCHSGSVLEKNINLIRCLVPERVGPMILTSCDQNEQSYPSREMQHGIFTAAVLESFLTHFTQVDSNNDEEIQPNEIANWVCERVPQILNEERHALLHDEISPDAAQTPQIFLPKVLPEHLRFRQSGN